MHGVWEGVNCNAKVTLTQINLKHQRVAWVTVSDPYVYSCYVPPSLTLSEFKHMLDKLVLDASRGNQMAIAGDFNARFLRLGSKESKAGA